ncbi:MAG: GAF domain-containing protein [Nitrospirae bacterium]|nr:GAF domain-containing protein [Nitrospirota bacterium]
MDPVERTELSILSEIGRISNSSDDLPRKLQRTIEAVMHGMGRDGASVFLVDRSGRNVILMAAIGLNQESVGRLIFPLGRGIAGWVAEQKVPLALADPYSDPRFQYVPESGIERFKSLAAAPIMDEDRCLGVLFVLSAETWSATSAEVTLLTTTANQLSGIIRSTRLFQNIQERLAHLSTIHEISMALSSTLDLKQLLALIARNSTQALHAQGCAIRLRDLTGDQFGGQAVSGELIDDRVRDLDARLAERVLDRTLRDRRPLLIADTYQDPGFQDLAGLPPTSLISVPLLFQDRVTGIITLYSPREGFRPFNEDDLQLLATIAGAAAVAIENAAMFERVDHLANEARNRAQEFSILYDVGTAMGSTLNLDRLLRIILTAATMGGTGLGFNRAILLLTNERANVLQGMMGVGPSSWDEANRAWTEVVRKHKSLMEWIQTGELFESKDTEFNALARSIRIPLEPGGGILAHTVLDKKAFNITDAASDPHVRHALLEMIKVNSFATVPLVAKSRVIGVVLVDNLFTQRPITDHDVRFLNMFAHQAALAIDNAIIHSNMETMNREIRAMHEQVAQSEKMAALGAMMAEITHEIRNPLVSIGGFTRRLARKVTDLDAKKYIDIILGEVGRLEGIIHDNLAYIKNVNPQFSLSSLNAVIAEVLMVYEDELRQRGIRIDRQLADGLPELEMDPQQVKQAIINLMTNAMEAMEKGGVLTVRTYPLADRRETALEIGDSGAGVSPEAMHNLFNPYYTTKARGTGLGLPIAHRIIKTHKGTIVFRNKEAGGALFTILLPWPQEKK